MKISDMMRLQAEMLESSEQAVADELRRRASVIDDMEADYTSGWEVPE
mgnify:CR=1 FL=1